MEAHENVLQSLGLSSENSNVKTRIVLPSEGSDHSDSEASSDSTSDNSDSETSSDSTSDHSDSETSSNSNSDNSDSETNNESISSNMFRQHQPYGNLHRLNRAHGGSKWERHRGIEPMEQPFKSKNRYTGIDANPEHFEEIIGGTEYDIGGDENFSGINEGSPHYGITNGGFAPYQQMPRGSACLIFIFALITRLCSLCDLMNTFIRRNSVIMILKYLWFSVLKCLLSLLIYLIGNERYDYYDSDTPFEDSMNLPSSESMHYPINKHGPSMQHSFGMQPHPTRLSPNHQSTQQVPIGHEFIHGRDYPINGDLTATEHTGSNILTDNFDNTAHRFIKPRPHYAHQSYTNHFNTKHKHTHGKIS